MTNNLIKQEIEVGKEVLTLEYGRFAEQANSAILARYGDTMVLVTAVSSNLKQELDYFPLSVDYMERLYAGGKIKGSRWVKREGKPTDEEILKARLIDRSIRPLFPKAFKKEVQIVATVLSVDGENDPGVLSLVAASAALAVSNIPWNGPIGALRLGVKDNTPFVNPTDSELKFSELDLVLTAGRENIIMIEAGANQVSEEKILEAIAFGQKEIQKIIEGIDELAGKIKPTKQPVVETKDPELLNLVNKKFGDDIMRFVHANIAREGADISELKQVIIEEVGVEKAALVPAIIDQVMKKRIRALVLKGDRLDGRKHNEVRQLNSEVGFLPRTHGSAMFKRGQTQVLSTTTLGAPNLEQLIESAEGEESKRYMHHYSMPAYATGETGRVGSPNRREIGHGALAERSLEPVIPTRDVFPYTIRVVSEVMSSNGSTSMASVCGSTMSLMDAGVPVIAPVSGIAMGLVIEEDKVAVLSDIMGMEDFNGDMDFKVAGTKTGVTAIQLDVKTTDLTHEILQRALNQAREGRLFILDSMLNTISQPRTKLSTYAPKVVVTKVPVDKIGEVIGPGGRMIKKIMLETSAQIDIEDDGSVTINGVNEESVQKARDWIDGMVKEVQAGEKYKGIVKRIQPFGAFVEILPGREGLVHISDLSDDYVSNPEEIVSIGQEIDVTVKEIDDFGRVNLTMRAGTGPKASMRQDGDEREEYRQTEGRRPFRRGLDRSRDRRGSRAPHFPASRYLQEKKRY